MTDHIDELLSRARLMPRAPYTQADIDAAHDRIAARLGRPPDEGPAPAGAAHDGRERTGADGAAERNLTTLCEVVLARPDGLRELRRFLDPSAVPEPACARVLGCVLSLACAPDSARTWWQYAAGAGDQSAAYCLSLYHRAHGEHGEADWWYGQADLAALATDQEPPDEQLTVALRVLRRLRGGRPQLSELVAALLAYVPAAVGFVDDDLDLPLPDPDFTERLEALVPVAPAPPAARRPDRAEPALEPLPERVPAPRRWPAGVAAAPAAS